MHIVVVQVGQHLPRHLLTHSLLDQMLRKSILGRPGGSGRTSGRAALSGEGINPAITD